jgi:hypothetical protein
MNTFQEGLVEASNASRAENYIRTAVLGDKDLDDITDPKLCIQAAQEVDVEAHYLQSVISESSEEVIALEAEVSEMEKTAEGLEGEALNDIKSEIVEKKELLSNSYSALKEVLTKVFGSIVDPQNAYAQIKEARHDLLLKIAETFQDLGGYQHVKPTDVGRKVHGPMGEATITEVTPTEVTVTSDVDGEPDTVPQSMFGPEGQIEILKQGLDQGPTPESMPNKPAGTPGWEGEGGAQADMDAGGSTFYDSKADMERNPMLDYLLGFELENPEQSGNKDVKVIPAKGLGTEEDEVEKPMLADEPYMSMSASVDHPDDKPGATKKNPQEAEHIEETPGELSFRLDALDPETKEWKEVKKFKTLEEAKAEEKELKDKMPMLVETQITNLTQIADPAGKPEYETTPEGPKGDNEEQEVKDEKTPGDYPGKKGYSSVNFRDGQWGIWLDDGNYKGINRTADPAIAAHIISRGTGQSISKAARILRYTKDTKRAYLNLK